MKKLILSLVALSAFTFSYAQKTTADVIIKSNKFSTLETALVSAELIPTLQASGPYTVFAPTNDAFDKLSPGVLGNLLTAASHDKLVTILKYHVMAGKWSTSSIKKAIKTGSGKADLKTIEGKNPSISLTYFSPNMEGGFPGNLTVDLTYTLTENNELNIEYKATTSEDTIINLTNHSYFNLEGHNGTVANQDLYINSKSILDTNEENIPTGLVLDINNSHFDFSTVKKCPIKIDTSFVLNKNNEVAASLYSESSNLKMLVYTDQPSVHIYVGGKCDEQLIGKEKSKYQTNSGVCFETQNFPDAPNHGHFPNSVLKKDETYLQKTIYKFEN